MLRQLATLSVLYLCTLPAPPLAQTAPAAPSVPQPHEQGCSNRAASFALRGAYHAIADAEARGASIVFGRGQNPLSRCDRAPEPPRRRRRKPAEAMAARRACARCDCRTSGARAARHPGAALELAAAGAPVMMPHPPVANERHRAPTAAWTAANARSCRCAGTVVRSEWRVRCDAPCRRRETREHGRSARPRAEGRRRGRCARWSRTPTSAAIARKRCVRVGLQARSRWRCARSRSPISRARSPRPRRPPGHQQWASSPATTSGSYQRCVEAAAEVEAERERRIGVDRIRIHRIRVRSVRVDRDRAV